MRPATIPALILLLGGCAAGPSPEELPAATALCEAPSFPQVQGGSHLIGDASPPVLYSSTPGTSGWHQSGQPPTAGAYQQPLREPAIVLALEASQVVAAYDADALPADEIARLTEVAESGDVGLVVTPFDGDMGAPLVLNGWGVRQPCEGLDEQALDRFVGTFASRAPGADG